MSSIYIGQIVCVGFNFAPVGWALCNGQVLPISENETLFNLIGTTFGGDGQSTFALPDLRGRTAIGQGSGPGLQTYVMGQIGGVESVTLTTQTLPSHTHPAMASANNGTSGAPANNVLAAGQQIYQAAVPSSGNALAAGAVLPIGGNQSHDNLQPYTTCNWIISLYGVYPQQG